MNNQNIPSLTGIRGVAALWFLIFHLWQAMDLPFTHWLKSIIFIEDGWRAVDLFFVLSGFILMHVHGADFHSFNRARTIDFFKKRFFRVYPLNAAVLVLIAILVFSSPSYVAWVRALDPAAYSTAGFVQRLFLASRWGLPDFGEWNGVTWSLSVEIVGYAFFPVICYVALRLGKAALMAALLFTCAVFLALAWRLGFDHDNLTNWKGVLRMFPEFTMGILAYRLREANWAKGTAKSIGYLGCAGLVAAMVVPGAGGFVPIAFTAIIFSCSFEEGVIATALRSRAGMFLGAISFSLYLVHLVLIDFGQSVFQGVPPFESLPLQVAGTLLAIAFLIGFGTAVHYAIELPLQRALRKRRPVRTETAIAVSP